MFVQILRERNIVGIMKDNKFNKKVMSDDYKTVHNKSDSWK